MDLKSAASSAIDKEREELRTLSDVIWRHPELGFQEHKACEVLTAFLKKRGFSVTHNFCDLETAFKAELGTKGSGVNVCVICEYDALPEIGHACGHNLIAEAGIATGLGLQAAIENGLVGHVTVMGTPAEEDGSGKVILIERGAFKDIDVAMMVHPAPHTAVYNQYLAKQSMKVTFIGKAAHAAAFPWEGVNALDAAITAYNSISVLRQQFKPTWRVHGIISEGGVKPNIIPDKVIMEYYVRAPSKEEYLVLKEKVISCFKAAAEATGCQVEITSYDEMYNLLSNPVIGDLYENNLRSLGVTDIKPSSPAGSTDMGNVSHVVPSIHPKYSIGSGQVNHSPEFTEAANFIDSHLKTLVAAKAMSYTCIDIMTKSDLMASIRTAFDKQINCSN